MYGVAPCSAMTFVLFTLAYPLCADTSRISKWAAVVCTRSESSLGQGVCRGGEGGQDGTPGHHRGPRVCAHQGYPGRLAPGSVQPVVRAAHGVDADLTEPADSVPQFGQSDRSRHAGGGITALSRPDQLGAEHLYPPRYCSSDVLSLIATCAVNGA